MTADGIGLRAGFFYETGKMTSESNAGAVTAGRSFRNARRGAARLDRLSTAREDGAGSEEGLRRRSARGAIESFRADCPVHTVSQRARGVTLAGVAQAEIRMSNSVDG